MNKCGLDFWKVHLLYACCICLVYLESYLFLWLIKSCLLIKNALNKNQKKRWLFSFSLHDITIIYWSILYWPIFKRWVDVHGELFVYCLFLNIENFIFLRVLTKYHLRVLIKYQLQFALHFFKWYVANHMISVWM